MIPPTLRRGATRRGRILFPSIQLDALAEVSGAAVFDPAFRFHTMEIPGFSIHYHQGLDNLAVRVAEIAGRVGRGMSEAFRWTPRETTQVVLVDGSDVANGFGGALPYNAMYILTTPPFADSTVGEYGGWLETVFIHEYAHVLSSDPSRGYAEVIRRIFAKPVPTADLFSLLVFIASAPPNNFLPRWWHEGMATWAETAFTSRGRGRSVYFDIVCRMAVHDGNFPSIDQINEDLPYWPDGNLPYVRGLRLQEYIADRYGGEAIGKLNQSHAGRFPCFINGAPEWVLDGKGYKALFGEMLVELQREQGERIAALKRSSFTSTRILPAEGEQLTRPRFSPDGKRIAFNRQDPHRHEAIVAMGADGSGQREVVRRLPSDRSLAWSPDGAAFAAVHSRRGSQNLSILRMGPGGTGREAWVAADNVTRYSLARISGPRWSPDGTRVAYAVAENGGPHRLELYDARDGVVSQFVESDAAIADPAWSGDGETIFHVSAETGVYNLFAVRVADPKPVRVTHLLGGAFHPDVSPGGDEVVFSSYTSRGFRVEAIRIDPATGAGIPGPVLRPPRQDGITEVAGTALQGLNIFEGRRDNLFAAGGYSDAVRYPYSFSFEEGRAIEGRFRRYSRSIGSDIAAREYLASWDEYLAVPSERSRHHVEAIRLRGGISDGERTAQNSFQPGGPPETLRDFPLRGYPSRFQTGKYAATGTVEYRFPVYCIFRGPGTAPVFFDRVHAAVFTDAGEAWGDGDSFSGNRLKVGAGVESRAVLTPGYWARIEPAIGFACGFNEDGKATVYFTVSMY